MGPSDGLGVLGLAGSGVVGALESRPQTRQSGVGRRLVSQQPPKLKKTTVEKLKLKQGMDLTVHFYFNQPSALAFFLFSQTGSKKKKSTRHDDENTPPPQPV